MSRFIFNYFACQVSLYFACFVLFLAWHGICYTAKRVPKYSFSLFGTQIARKKRLGKVKKELAITKGVVHHGHLMKSLTHSQFVKIIESTQGAAIVGIEAITDAKPLKTGNPFDGINKHVRAVGFVGANYGEAVKREGTRQGVDASEFVADSRPWGEWLVPHKVATHKGELYLRTQSTPGQRNRQPARLLAYRDNNGKFLSRDEVKPFLPKKTESAKQAAAGLVGKVDVREYKFSSIRKVRVNGQTFALVKD